MVTPSFTLNVIMGQLYSKGKERKLQGNGIKTKISRDSFFNQKNLCTFSYYPVERLFLLSCFSLTRSVVGLLREHMALRLLKEPRKDKTF